MCSDGRLRVDENLTSNRELHSLQCEEGWMYLCHIEMAENNECLNDTGTEENNIVRRYRCS